MFNWVRKVNNQECIWQQTLEFTQQTRGYKSQLAHVISPVSMSQTGVNKSIRRFCLPKDTTQLTQQLLNLSEHTAQMSTLSHCTNTWYLVIQTNIVIIPLRAQWSQVTLPESQVETQVFHRGTKGRMLTTDVLAFRTQSWFCQMILTIMLSIIFQKWSV